jgi:DNA-binding CsgD family transcriptional regulator
MLKVLVQRLLDRLGMRPGDERLFALEDAMVDTVDALAEHEQRPADEILSDLLASGLAQHDLAQEAWQRWLALTPRQQQVAALICLDYTNRQIAARLGISAQTVKAHVRTILYQFRLHSKGELRMLLSRWDFSAWDT